MIISREDECKCAVCPIKTKEETVKHKINHFFISKLYSNDDTKIFAVKKISLKFKEETATTMGFLSGYDVEKVLVFDCSKDPFQLSDVYLMKSGNQCPARYKKKRNFSSCMDFFIIIIVTLFLNTVEHNQQPMWMQLWNIYPKWLVSIFEKKQVPWYKFYHLGLNPSVDNRRQLESPNNPCQDQLVKVTITRGNAVNISIGSFRLSQLKLKSNHLREDCHISDPVSSLVHKVQLKMQYLFQYRDGLFTYMKL